RSADDGDLGHGLVRVDGVLDFTRSHQYAAGVDDILDAIDYRDVAGLVAGDQVTGMEPAITERRRRFLRFVPVALAQLRRSVQDFTLFTGADFIAFGINYTCLHEVDRTSAGRWALAMFLGAQHGRQGGDFRLPEAIVKRQLRVAFAQPVEYGYRHDGGAVLGFFQ